MVVSESPVYPVFTYNESSVSEISVLCSSSMRLQLGVKESILSISSSWFETGEGVDAVLNPSISVKKEREF